ncbi:uncharacterized protein [Heptranchias perlo]|uniref:uncharacterized protein isoform X2 n=1 Tax=Heptranchias perlo TaxID=212740 RepID=UPI003559B5E0
MFLKEGPGKGKLLRNARQCVRTRGGTPYLKELTAHKERALQLQEFHGAVPTAQAEVAAMCVPPGPHQLEDTRGEGTEAEMKQEDKLQVDQDQDQDDDEDAEHPRMEIGRSVVGLPIATLHREGADMEWRRDIGDVPCTPPENTASLLTPGPSHSTAEASASPLAGSHAVASAPTGPERWGRESMPSVSALSGHHVASGGGGDVPVRQGRRQARTEDWEQDQGDPRLRRKLLQEHHGYLRHLGSINHNLSLILRKLETIGHELDVLCQLIRLGARDIVEACSVVSQQMPMSIVPTPPTAATVVVPVGGAADTLVGSTSQRHVLPPGSVPVAKAT